MSRHGEGSGGPGGATAGLGSLPPQLLDMVAAAIVRNSPNPMYERIAEDDSILTH